MAASVLIYAGLAKVQQRCFCLECALESALRSIWRSANGRMARSVTGAADQSILGSVESPQCTGCHRSGPGSEPTVRGPKQSSTYPTGRGLQTPVSAVQQSFSLMDSGSNRQWAVEYLLIEASN